MLIYQLAIHSSITNKIHYCHILSNYSNNIKKYIRQKFKIKTLKILQQHVVPLKKVAPLHSQKLPYQSVVSVQGATQELESQELQAPELHEQFAGHNSHEAEYQLSKYGLAQALQLPVQLSQPQNQLMSQLDNQEHVIVVTFQLLPDGHFKHFERVEDQPYFQSTHIQQSV
ncbi:hypothetical protein ABPG74_003678 [Tetrahymena malaccensis]